MAGASVFLARAPLFFERNRLSLVSALLVVTALVHFLRTFWEEGGMPMSELLIVFILGYVIGGVSALALFAFTLASRNEPRRHRRNTTHKV